MATDATGKEEKASSLKRKPSAALKRGSKERAVEGPKSDNNAPKRLSEVRKSHVIDPFGISVRSLGKLDLEVLEAVVTSIIRDVQASRKRGQYSKSVVHILERDNFDVMWKGAVVEFGLRGRLALSQRSYGTKSEAWARRIIDSFVDVLLGGDSVSHSLCQLEMDLATKQQPKGEGDHLRTLARKRPVAAGYVEPPAENPGRIQKGDVFLEVTGSIDYILITLPSSRHCMYLDTLEEAVTLDRAAALLHPSIAEHLNFLPIEAKRMDPEEDIVSRNLPQVLAQAHLSMRKTGRQEMPWVLSSGDRWVFGISHATEGGDWKSVYVESRPLFDHTICASEVSEGKRRELGPEQLDALMDRAKAVMRILTVWRSAPMKLLWNVFTKTAKSGL